jgi:DNA recombination protein RmuC
VIVSLLAVVFAGLWAWTLLRQSKAGPGAALAARDLEAARAEVARVSRELNELRDERDAQQRRADDLDVKRATLAERLDATTKAAESRAQEIERLYEEKLTALRNEAGRHRQELQERLAEADKRFKEAFENTATRAADTSAERLLKLAKEHFTTQHAEQKQSIEKLVSPISEMLKRTDEKLASLEKQRIEAQSKLLESIGALQDGSRSLSEETRRLATALRKPQVRGRYGEVQLERVAELAGMTNYCDFSTQASVNASTDGKLRPDMVVRLPNERCIVVDAKTNIEPYMEALESDDPDAQRERLDAFARGVLDQAHKLAKKAYWSGLDGSPEFCVMFIPGDQFIDAALEREPKLLELAAEQDILLASPSTLIGLLRAVAVGWREKSLSDSAKELFELGKELHERAARVMELTGDVGKHLDRATRSYNQLVGSMESRLTPTLRKFEETGAKSAKQLDEPKPIESSPRESGLLPSGVQD